MSVNPLEILGVPKFLIAEAVDKDDFAALAPLVTQQARLLSRHCHPDRGGSDQQMAMVSLAADDLSDPDGLAFYATELIGGSDLVRAKKQLNQIERQQKEHARVQNLIDLTWNTNQYEILGITGPQQILLPGQLTHHRLSIESPNEVFLQVCRQTATTEVDVKIVWNPDQGYFEEVALDTGETLNAYTSFSNTLWHVRVIGFVPQHITQPVDDQLYDIANDSIMVESNPNYRDQVRFMDPNEAWFLNHITPDYADTSNLVVAQKTRDHLTIALCESWGLRSF